MNGTAFTVSRVVSLATVVTAVVILGSGTDVPAVSGAMAVAPPGPPSAGGRLG
ncbi:hypothetical protein [Streptomyces narbonensis]|uniref:hypothetical protein n=1 Tax=Streptomyces narbonensis TaxID=67333 RepID=UPI003401FCD4